MAEPITLGTVAVGGLAWVGAGIVGNASYQGVVGLAKATGDRLGGLLGVPEGDDIARAVRRAQLAALERTVRDYWKVGRPEWQDEPHTRPDMFHDRSLAFCSNAVGRCPDLTLKVNDELTPHMVAALDGALAARTGTAEGAQDGLATLTEDAVLDELRQHLDGVQLPDGFEDHFRQGSGQHPRFMDAFGAFITREFRDNGRFRNVFIGAKLVEIEGLANDAITLLASLEQRFGSTLDRIDARTDRMESDLVATKAGVEDGNAKLDRLLALAEAGGAFSKAEEAGISVAAVRGIVARLGGEDIGEDDLLPWLENWIAAAQRQLGQHSNGGDAFEAARREAEKRFREGRIGEASRPFMEELEREESQEQERQEERRRRRSRLLEEAIRFDELAFDPSAGVEKLLLLAENEGIVGADDLPRWLVDRAKDYFDRGDIKGDNAALLFAIAAYREALKEWTREREPLQWAGTQSNLGNALSSLGARESGTARLEEAVAAYRAALEEWVRAREPLEWAGTQNNLGAALQTLGMRESGTGLLEAAVAAFRAALEERTREREPLEWAATQNNLANALSSLGERESGTERLEEAVDIYRAVLEEWTRKRLPLDWAWAQNNLSNALHILGERESGTARLEEAVAACRAALEELTRDRVPLDWAWTQNNLGNALSSLGARESGTARLEEAIAAYRAALEEWTRERVPLQWAMTQNSLGNALSSLGERESGTKRLEQAVAAYRAALEVLNAEEHPYFWKVATENLDRASKEITRRSNDSSNEP